MVTDLDITTAIRKLAVAFTKPDAPEADLVGLWKHVLEDVDASALREAVSRYLKSDNRFFPKPGQMLWLVREVEGETFGEARRERGEGPWDQLQEGPCPVCRATMQLQPPPRHSHTHQAVFDWKIGAYRARTEQDERPTHRYRIIHDRAAHERAKVPAVGDWQ